MIIFGSRGNRAVPLPLYSSWSHLRQVLCALRCPRDSHSKEGGLKMMEACCRSQMWTMHFFSLRLPFVISSFIFVCFYCLRNDDVTLERTAVPVRENTGSGRNRGEATSCVLKDLVYVLVRPTFVKYLIREATKFMAGMVIRALL